MIAVVFYHERRVDDLRDSLRLGAWPLTKTLATGTARGVSALARRLGPTPAGDVVELEPLEDDVPPAWTPGADDPNDTGEEVA